MTTYEAVTAKGAVIRTFETRELAKAWAETEGQYWPGCLLRSREDPPPVYRTFWREGSKLRLVGGA